MTAPEEPAAFCPVAGPGDTITSAHGGGGRLMRDLIERHILPALGDSASGAATHDGAVVEIAPGRLAFTTDSYVVRPRRFPGGDIGRLAVFGTVNDLAMCGATPRWLSLSLIVEEGLAIAELEAYLHAAGQAAVEAGVAIATGDLKVVEQGHGDGLYINTTGIGVLHGRAAVAPDRIAPGDAVLVSGDLGRHGIAVLSRREGLTFDTPVLSDLAPVTRLVDALLARVEVHCLRDLTRGGLGAALNELAGAAAVSIEVEEPSIPVSSEVSAACELLGLDPLFVACEGRFVLFVPEAQAADALACLKALAPELPAARIGRVSGHTVGGAVTLSNAWGTRRVLPYPSGELLPRIC